MFIAPASARSRGGPLSPPDSARHDRTLKRKVTGQSCTSLGGQDSPLRQELLKRTWDLEHKIDQLDSHFKILSSASAMSMVKLDKRLDEIGLRLRMLTTESALVAGQVKAFDGIQTTNGTTDIAPGCSEYQVSRAFDPPPITTQTERSVASLPLPIGDLIAVDAPIWDVFPKPIKPPIPVQEVAAYGTETDMNQDFSGFRQIESGASQSFQAAQPSYTSDVQAIRRRSQLNSISDLQAMTNSRSPIFTSIWSFLDDPETSFGAKVYSKAMPYIILLSVFVSIMQTGSPPLFTGTSALVSNTIFEVLFLAEFLLRMISCPTKRAFIVDYNNYIDFLAVVPLFLRVVLGDTAGRGEFCNDICLGMMCTTPLLRALKYLRRFETLPLLTDSMDKASEGLPVCMFVLLCIILLFAPVIYLVEPSIESIPMAMWLTVVTMTTVGYGDITPQTTAGSLVVSALVILSVLYMAMPLGIVGNAFTEVWQDRSFILLRYRTIAKFAQWGYAPHDVPSLFMLFSEDGSGELGHEEFKAMMQAMQVGLADDRINQLFEALDEDEGGSIDDQEFVKRVFPDSFRDLYERKVTK